MKCRNQQAKIPSPAPTSVFLRCTCICRRAQVTRKKHNSLIHFLTPSMLPLGWYLGEQSEVLSQKIHINKNMKELEGGYLKEEKKEG